MFTYNLGKKTKGDTHMGFGEKLFKLRKEKGLSQEALAEKLNTTRQAVSKWENGQGFPETEKLIMIGNVFEVSLDYLLKETAEQSNENVDGYYVSQEMAEGYVVYGQKISKYIALGFSLLILSTIPYLLFKRKCNNVDIPCHYYCCSWNWSNDGTCNDRRESIQCIEKRRTII